MKYHTIIIVFKNMDVHLAKKFHKKIHEHGKLYGITTIGARGQVVIPASARKDLKIKPKDQLVVVGNGFGAALGLLKIEEMEKIVNKILKDFSDSGPESVIKQQMANILKQARNLTSKTKK